MFAFRNLLCAALTLGVLFSAPAAEARFGKRSDSSDSDKKEKRRKKKKEQQEEREAPRQDHRVHGASPVGSPPPPPAPPPPPPPPQRVVVVESPPPPPPPPPTYYTGPSRSVRQSAPRGASTIDTRMGMDGGGMGGGVGLNFFLAFEGVRMGLDGRLLALYLPDGGGGVDRIVVSGVNFTYALVAHERLRLRLEGGLSVADAPDLKVVGPSLGASLNAILAGPLDLELRVQGTPFPYRQLDAQAGLAVHLRALVLRGGWRTMLLNDAGLVDGVVHQDILSGPYVGAGFSF